MASIKQSYSPINSLQKMVDEIPSTDKTKHKKHKEDKKEWRHHHQYQTSTYTRPMILHPMNC